MATTLRFRYKGSLTTSTLNAELTSFQQQFNAAKTEAGALAAGLQESQFNWRPDPGHWSIAECLLHLNIVADRYVHSLEIVLADARTQGLTGQSAAAHGWLGNWILRNTEPPPRRRFRAGRSFIPVDSQPVTAVLPTFQHLQDQLAIRVEQSDGLDLSRVKVPTPGFGTVRFNLRTTFAWIAAHERRHLWQAAEVRKHPSFPR